MCGASCVVVVAFLRCVSIVYIARRGFYILLYCVVECPVSVVGYVQSFAVILFFFVGSRLGFVRLFIKFVFISRRLLSFIYSSACDAMLKVMFSEG